MSGVSRTLAVVSVVLGLQVTSMGRLPPFEALYGVDALSALLDVKTAHQEPITQALKLVFKRYNMHAGRFGVLRMDRQGWHRVVNDAGLAWDQERRRGGKALDRPYQQDDAPWTRKHQTKSVRCEFPRCIEAIGPHLFCSVSGAPLLALLVSKL